MLSQSAQDIIRKITIWTIISTVIILLCWDGFAYLKGGGGATISEIIWAWSKDYPFIPFCFGILMGHLFTIPKGKS